MSLIIDALNKARQTSSNQRAATDPHQLMDLTGTANRGGSPLSARLIAGSITFAAVLAVGTLLVAGWWLKPAPRAASADLAPLSAAPAPVVAPAPAPIVADAQRSAQPNEAQSPSKPSAVPAEASESASPAQPILAVQPWLKAEQRAVEPETEAISPIAEAPPASESDPVSVDPAQTSAAPPAVESETTPTPEPASAEPPAPPKPKLIADTEYVQTLDVADVPALKLGAIIWSDGMKIALINGATLEPGQEVAGVNVITVDPKRVQLQHQGRRFWLRLP